MLTSLVYSVEKIAMGLYLLSVAGIVLMAYRFQQARRELSVAQFKLERDIALVKRANAITFGLLLVEFMFAVWAIANLMAPTVRDIELGNRPNNTVVMERFVTSTPAANAPVSLDTGGPQVEGPDIFATPVPTVTPVGTILPDAPSIDGCPRDSAWLLVPGNGQRIFEATTIVGTANVANFSFYRFEIRQAVPGTQFAPLGGDNTQPVTDGPLGEIVPFELANGEYRFRLTVFDNTETMRAWCEVTIHITDPPLTPTPIGAGAEATPAQ